MPSIISASQGEPILSSTWHAVQTNRTRIKREEGQDDGADGTREVDNLLDEDELEYPSDEWEPEEVSENTTGNVVMVDGDG